LDVFLNDWQGTGFKYVDRDIKYEITETYYKFVQKPVSWIWVWELLSTAFKNTVCLIKRMMVMKLRE
jgi:hypothetical protein